MATVMAASARSSVFLPTVKCSNCNAKIEISLMGEHVCSQGIAQFPGAFMYRWTNIHNYSSP